MDHKRYIQDLSASIGVFIKIYSAIFPGFQPLSDFYPELPTRCVRGNDELKSPGILIIHGGGDIHPSYYGRVNDGSYAGVSPSIRDQEEVKLFCQAVIKKLFIFGICRGAQIGCALSGGFLVQDVDGHGWSHRITTDDGRTLMSSSLHHQMMYPWEIEHKLLAWSAVPRGSSYRGISETELAKWPTKMYEAFDKPMPIEPEVVWFPTTRCLAIQGHPEMMDSRCDFNRYIRELVDEHCFS